MSARDDPNFASWQAAQTASFAVEQRIGQRLDDIERRLAALEASQDASKPPGVVGSADSPTESGEDA